MFFYTTDVKFLALPGPVRDPQKNPAGQRPAQQHGPLQSAASLRDARKAHRKVHDRRIRGGMSRGCVTGVFAQDQRSAGQFRESHGVNEQTMGQCQSRESHGI